MEAAAGLGALGFWLFVAAVVVAGIWFDARKREMQQETLRRIVESGQTIDAALIDKMVAAGGAKTHVDRDLKTSGVIVMFVAPGLAILGWFLGQTKDGLFGQLLGVSLLVAFVGIGLFVAGKFSERWYREDKS